MNHSYYAYIATNINNAVLYIGVTNNLERRMNEHIHKAVPGFTSKYNVVKLIWFEEFRTPQEAIAAEKRIKGWKREKKMALIQNRNSEFIDLFQQDPSRGSG